MKRGRPNTRVVVQDSIIEVLNSFSTPMTISALSKVISDKFSKQVSWNTVQKYMNELVEMDKVLPMDLPHSKLEGKVGLTVYQIKK
jgi:hypothetical protein